MTSPRWMILLCFSLISVFGTGKSFMTIKPSKTVAPSSLAAIIAGMSKPIADLNASYNRLLAQKKGISCPCNASMIQACNNQRNLLKQGLISCDSQLGSANVQKTSLQQQVNVLNSQLRSEIAQRTSLQQQVNVLNSQLRSEIVQRNSLPQVNVLNSQLKSEIARRTALQQQVNVLNSQLSSANAQRSSLQQQVNDLNSQLSSANAQRSSLQQQVNDLRSQLTLVTKQRDAFQTGPQNERWQSFNGHLYYLSTTTADWQTSRNDCLSKGADLVIINDAAENDFARGLNRKAWMGLKKSGSTWTWVDGSILLPSVSYWGPGEPNNQLNLEDRAEIGIWVQSFGRKPKLNKGVRPELGLKMRDGNLSMDTSKTTADWQTSRNDCLSKGADLLIINDAAENNYAGGFNRKVWIGLYKAEGTWTWVNGIRLDFDPCVNYWAKGEPNNVGNQEDRAELLFFDKIDSFVNVDRGHLGNCLEFFGRSEKVNSWNDAPGSKSNYWICEKEVV